MCFIRNSNALLFQMHTFMLILLYIDIADKTFEIFFFFWIESGIFKGFLKETVPKHWFFQIKQTPSLSLLENPSMTWKFVLLKH